MSNVLFTRKNGSEEISAVPVTDGQILFDTSGNGKMYLDNGTNRLEMGGARETLDNLSDIANVTQTGFLPDAMAIKELLTKLHGDSKVLTAGETTITFTDSSITTNSVFDFYSDKYGLYANEVTVVDGSVTLTFDEQESNVTIKVRWF